MGGKLNATRRVAIITGGSSGVGAATARKLAAHDFNIVVNYNRGRDAAHAVVESCQQSGVDACAVQGDVAEDRDCRNIAQAATEHYGRIDALVNSAGTTRFVPMSDLEALDAADFQRVYAVNTIGVFQMVRAVLPVMRLSGGSIVNISSIGGAAGTGSSYAYTASKAALNSLTIALARNLAPEIRVNGVAPGAIEGRWLLQGLGEEKYRQVKDKYSAESALGRICTPEDIADAVGWLTTGAAAVTGQIVNVDAGSIIGRRT